MIQKKLIRKTNTLFFLVFILTGFVALGQNNTNRRDKPEQKQVSTSKSLTKENAESRPNIILIVVDDLRWDEFSAGGHPYLKTPNIDRLAKEGALFENAYHVCPLCSPNRASILTGQYPSRHGIIDNVARDKASHLLQTFPIELRKAGYETGHVGKWHMGNDATPRPGYDYWVAFPGQGRIINPILNENGRVDTVKGYVTDILTDRAISFIDKKRNKPFFLYLGHKAVHPDAKQLNDGSLDINYGAKFIPAPQYDGKYDGAIFKRKKNYIDNYNQIDTQIITGHFLADKNSAKTRKQFGNMLDDFTTEETIRKRSEMILSVDESVGKILKQLEKQKILDHTCIIFTSDNGYFFGEHGLSIERRLPYEESVKAPLLIRYPPLIKPGTREKAFVVSIDYAPTILALGGVKPGPGIQGRSILPLLKGNSKNWRHSFMMEYYGFENPFPWLIDSDYKALRNEQYKYIHWIKFSGKDELYDLKNDPFELNNLYNDPTYKKIAARMQKELSKYVAESIGL